MEIPLWEIIGRFEVRLDEVCGPDARPVIPEDSRAGLNEFLEAPNNPGKICEKRVDLEPLDDLIAEKRRQEKWIWQWVARGGY